MRRHQTGKRYSRERKRVRRQNGTNLAWLVIRAFPRISFNLRSYSEQPTNARNYLSKKNIFNQPENSPLARRATTLYRLFDHESDLNRSQLLENACTAISVN